VAPKLGKVAHACISQSQTVKLNPLRTSVTAVLHIKTICRQCDASIYSKEMQILRKTLQRILHSKGQERHYTSNGFEK
jgi:hypothetical protein